MQLYTDRGNSTHKFCETAEIRCLLHEQTMVSSSCKLKNDHQLILVLILHYVTPVPFTNIWLIFRLSQTENWSLTAQISETTSVPPRKCSEIVFLTSRGKSFVTQHTIALLISSLGLILVKFSTISNDKCLNSILISSLPVCLHWNFRHRQSTKQFILDVKLHIHTINCHKLENSWIEVRELCCILIPRD